MAAKLKVISWLAKGTEGTKLVDILLAEGHSCLSCDDVVGFEKLILKHHHDVGMIMLDEDMLVNIDPLELCRDIKANQLLHAFLLFAANSSQDISEVDALDNGVDIFIYKPFKSALLSTKIVKTLARR